MMPNLFLSYIKKTYPNKKVYALAALQDAASMLAHQDALLQQQLVSYFKITPEIYAKLSHLLADSSQQDAHTIGICLGPVCRNHASEELFFKTRGYLSQADTKYTLKKMHCQAKCAQAPIVCIDAHVMTECSVENIFTSIK